MGIINIFIIICFIILILIILKSAIGVVNTFEKALSYTLNKQQEKENKINCKSYFERSRINGNKK